MKTENVSEIVKTEKPVIVHENQNTHVNVTTTALTTAGPAPQIGSLYQLLVTISILISQVLGMTAVLGTAELWPYLLALTIAPAIFQLAVLPLCPESPRFTLINKNKEVAAQQGQWGMGIGLMPFFAAIFH